MQPILRTASLCLLALCTLAATGVAQEKKAAKPSPPKELNASHILISYKGIDGIDATRTKEEARALAKEIAEMAKKDGTLAGFEKLAAEKSDGPSRTTGGDLGNFKPEMMVPEFSRATLDIEIGDVSDPVESQFGFHIIRRKKVVDLIGAAHIVIAWKGAQYKPVERSKEEALKLAKEVAKKAKEKDADFTKLVEEYSDFIDKSQGGDLGVFTAGGAMSKPVRWTRRMVPIIWWKTQNMKVGEISEPIESPLNAYHIIVRKPVQQAGSRHILVQWKEARNASQKGITRTKEEAMTRAKEILAKLEAGEKFEKLAVEFSDGPSGKDGGELGVNVKGRMVPEFDAALFKLKVGAVSEPVETAFGYHIIYRYK